MGLGPGSRKFRTPELEPWHLRTPEPLGPPEPNLRIDWAAQSGGAFHT